MKVALVASSPAELPRTFLQKQANADSLGDIQFSYVIVDEQTDKKENPLRRFVHVAKRQARCNGRFWPWQFLCIVFYKWRTRFKEDSSIRVPTNNGEDALANSNFISVPSINAETTRAYFTQNPVDLVCLMGTRILNRKTLQAIEKSGAKVINVHSSDPALVRGGPVVVWEILKGQNAITITIHEVLAELDAGAVYAQETVPIQWSHSLAATVAKTMQAAEPVVIALFENIIHAIQKNTLQPRSFALAPIFVTPSIGETIRAEKICRGKHA